MIPLDDTIAAIATPIGEGGISVIRVSGSSAIEIADKGFHGKNPLVSVATHTAHFGQYMNTFGNIIDEVVLTVFRHPRSYTGEDVVEISCHGGLLVTKTLLAEILNNGARLAQPGEFTKRAFLNGKIDLLQAEAVADLIKARSEAAQACSIMQLQGKLSNEISNLRKKLTDLVSLVELEIDFAEEDIRFAGNNEIMNGINDAENKIDYMLNSYSAGKLCKEGVRVVLVGRPNVGKSSILNRLLKANRAIVTDIPGTTRDTIEESVNINGITYTFVDTAGLRDSTDLVEIEGIRRTELEISSAGIILFIIDLTDKNTMHDKLILNSIIKSANPFLLVGNKNDLLGNGNVEKLIDNCEHYESVTTSATTGTGFDELRRLLFSMVESEIGRYPEKSTLINNLRHVCCLNEAISNLRNARESLLSSLTAEFISVDLRRACNSLGEIIGEVTSEDILNNIFGKFCIGK
jgi:tRNA modification GTPase